MQSVTEVKSRLVEASKKQDRTRTLAVWDSEAPISCAAMVPASLYIAQS